MKFPEVASPSSTRSLLCSGRNRPASGDAGEGKLYSSSAEEDDVDHDVDQQFLKRASEIIRFYRTIIRRVDARGAVEDMKGWLQPSAVQGAPSFLDFISDPGQWVAERLAKAQVALDDFFDNLWVKPSFLKSTKHGSTNLEALRQKCIGFLLGQFSSSWETGGVFTRPGMQGWFQEALEDYVQDHWCAGEVL